MLFNQMQLRYSEDSWLTSNYLAEFFRMCGFVVCEQNSFDFKFNVSMEEEIRYFEEAHKGWKKAVKKEDELIISVKPKELGKQLLEDVVSKYLVNLVDITKLHPLIDFYVDYSVYELVKWLEYYAKYDSEENHSIHKKKGGAIMSFIREDPNNLFATNEFAQFARFYCQYHLNCFMEICHKILPYDIEKFANECSKLIKEFRNSFLISGNILMGLMYYLDKMKHMETIFSFLDARNSCSISLYKDVMSWYIGKVYFRYAETRAGVAIRYYRSSLKYLFNISVLCDLVVALKRSENILSNLIKSPFDDTYGEQYKEYDSIKLLKDRANYKEASELWKKKKIEVANERLFYIKYGLSWIENKEKYIPLNPKELRLRVWLIRKLMEIEPPLQWLNYLEESYAKIDTSNFYLYDVTEFSSNSHPNLIIKRYIDYSLEWTYTSVASAYSNIGNDELFKLYMQKAQELNKDL